MDYPTTGVGVLDKSVWLLAAVADEPLTLAGLVEATGIARPTAHRLAQALVAHRLMHRDSRGRFAMGPRCAEFAKKARDPFLDRAQAVVERLRDLSQESAQLYVREGEGRRCVAAADRATGLRDSVAVGALLPMTAGSAAQVLTAYACEQPPEGAAFTKRTLGTVLRQGWAASVAEREQGVASVSAPVFDPAGKLLGALSISGPVERLGRSPGRLHADAVVEAARELAPAEEFDRA